MQQSRHYLFVKTLLNRMKMDDVDAPAIEQELYRLEAGLSGEQKLKRLLSDYHFKSASHIFYNFECINSKGFTHQMDALLITPNFVVIMEVKQMSGTLFYKPALHEFSRVFDNTTENFPNPFDQTYRHQLFWNINSRRGKFPFPFTTSLCSPTTAQHSTIPFPVSRSCI